MDIKWKNRIVVAAWVLLFTFGLNGIFWGLSNSDEYLKKSYFYTQRFENQLSNFTNYLSLLELSYLPKEEMKESIIVSEEEINEHRYRYGNLTEQIENIKGQYEGKIQEAQINNNAELTQMYIDERDKK
ncbi:hypothetical protein N752_18855 [Desulforamulus aquiferis]|nr:hypothetical protein [Desulforamulus aquiferis]RYD03635.1 hypothetical protein N752_18855 [Desulforamulus aquiferis]